MTKEKVKIEAIIGKKYDIKSQIAVGGMGKIYLGVHRALNKRVAVKIIHQEFRKDETFRKRFHREARLAANLHHPGIVDIYDFGSSEHFDYIIMPFIDGETLKEKLKREKKLPISKSLELIAAISSALSFAHKNKVVHRDIKPSNILIDKQEHAYLTDFGISKDLGDVDLTLPDTVMGSPRYISPEQISGKEVDGRCDLYALGLVFYEMVSGRYPYAGRNANAVYYAQMNEVPQRPDQIEPDIPNAVSDIIMKLIEKLPDNRYQKASQILQDIANAKSGLPLVQSSEAGPLVESNPVIIGYGAIDDKENDDNGTDDQPTVLNVSRKDRGRLFDNQQIVVESSDPGRKSEPIRISPRRLILFGSGLVLCVVIGYFILYSRPSPTDMLVVQENKPDALPAKSSSIDGKHSSDRPSPIQPIKGETQAEKSEPILKKPSLDSSEVSLSAIDLEQPTEQVSLASLVEQLKTLEESEGAKFVQLWTEKSVYKIGDSIAYHFQSSQDCHLIVILFSSSGEIIQVFPNRYHPDSFVSTGLAYTIPAPDSDIDLEVTGPPGIEKLMAIVTDTPLKVFPFNFEDMPFFVVDETDRSLLKRIDANLHLAKKRDFKHKRVKYVIAK